MKPFVGVFKTEAFTLSEEGRVVDEFVCCVLCGVLGFGRGVVVCILYFVFWMEPFDTPCAHRVKPAKAAGQSRMYPYAYIHML
jgi:hypothetical protein